MTGMIFTELLSMAEQVIGEDAVDDNHNELKSHNDTSYNAVGNHPCSEMMAIAGAYGDRAGIAVPELQCHFGRGVEGQHSDACVADAGEPAFISVVPADPRRDKAAEFCVRLTG